MHTFPDFAPRGAMPQTTLDAYRGRVPAELVDFWQHYGTGSFLEGYIRVIDPAEYEPAIGDCIGRVIGGTEAVPVMVTGLADLITWEAGKGFTMIEYRNEDTQGLGETVDVFLGLLELDGTEELDDNWDWSAYRDAVAAQGPLAHDESFVYVPLPSLGGDRAAENLERRATIEAIRMMVELQGLVEH